MVGFYTDTLLTILWISGKSKDIERIKLMLIMDEEKSHYCWIKNMGRLLYGKTKKRGWSAVLLRCLPVAFYQRKSSENAPGVLCWSKWALDAYRYAEKGGNTLKFENHQKQQKAPYVIYAEFESIIEVLPEEERDRAERLPTGVRGQSPLTVKTAKHVASGVAYTVVRSDGKSWSKKYRQGADGNAPAAKEFLKSILWEEETIQEELRMQEPLRMRRQDWGNFKKAKNCWICQKSLWVENFRDSVAVLDPPTGKYCGQSHRKCRWDGVCEETENLVSYNVTNDCPIRHNAKRK